jgi:hypothetical protein
MADGFTYTMSYTFIYPDCIFSFGSIFRGKIQNKSVFSIFAIFGEQNPKRQASIKINITMSTQITPLAGCVLIVSYLAYRIFRTYWKLRHVPGPFWAGITNLQRILWVKTGRSHEIYQDLHEKHGDVVRIGPNVVSISDPAAISTIYPMRPGFPKVRLCLLN